MRTLNRIGFDLGDTITDLSKIDKRELLRNPKYISTIPFMPGAEEALKEIARTKGSSSIFIISKVSHRAEMLTLQWLLTKKFYGRTGILQTNVHFVRTSKEKALAAHHYELDAYFDNEPLNILIMCEYIPHTFLFKPRPDSLYLSEARVRVTEEVQSWNRVCTICTTW
jgi:hypothetical protein